MLKLSISGFEKLANKLASQINSAIEREAEQRVKILVRNLALATPVDTGYAASRWTYAEKKDSTLIYKVKAGSVFFNFNVKEYAISNDAPYIIYLNQGWSKQAPSYFIEQTIMSSGFKINEVIVNSGGKDE